MRAQVAFQFLVMVSIVFVLFVVFVAGFAERYRDIKMEKERVAVKDLTLKIHDELTLAHTMEDGYTRVFTLPDTLQGSNYTIDMVGNVLAVASDYAEYSISVPPVTGTPAIGNNTIKKEEGAICLGC